MVIFSLSINTTPPAEGEDVMKRVLLFSLKPYVFKMDGMFHNTLQISLKLSLTTVLAGETVPQKTPLTLGHLAFANDGANLGN